ncbi:MAG: mannose-1-phosphate guanylyltransferase/mannose-6-phosphate isomerase [Alphaproteobacteria bacterium]|nr:mannose-1-phosphate guanylyltransferase/mannose-6-phosphate isomerase [Alphaproteobacteria bacterium]
MKITPLILSGGSGTRLWPVSRELNPKQFLDFFGKHSLFQQAALRLRELAKPIIICNNEHRFTVAEELQKLGIEAQAIILEPIARNTAPAIAAAAFAVGENDLLLVTPSDHLIRDEKEFLAQVKNAAAAASEGFLITFGIKPDKAETGYGYIKKGVGPLKKWGQTPLFSVEKFVEKPDQKTAEEFLADGRYFWNSGIFLFRAGTYLEALKKYQPEILEHCKRAYQNAERDLDFTRLTPADFAQCPNISVDYAVMEKAEKVAVAPVEIGWSDVGSWLTVAELSAQDENKNTLLGNSFALHSSNCYVNSRETLVAVIGATNLIVVALKDVVLVVNKNNAQDVKKMFELLKNQKFEECVVHRKVLRPWGSFEVIDSADRFKVKRITVKPGAALSLQMHNYRSEHWIVVKGEAHVTCGEREFVLSEDQSTYISVGQKHRLTNKSKIPLELIEVQTGSYLGEDDIVRFSDVYGRSGKS